MKENKSKLLKTLSILTIIYGVIGIIDAFIGLNKPSQLIILMWSIIVSPIGLAIIILSIISIINFTKNKFQKITLVLPIYHLVSGIFLFIVSFIIGFIAGFTGNVENFALPIWYVVLGIILSIFEIIWPIYILKKFK